MKPCGLFLAPLIFVVAKTGDMPRAGAAPVNLSQGTPISEVPNPRASGGWVVDMAKVFGREEVDEMNRLVMVTEEQSSAEIAIVTVSQTATTPKAFALQLFNAWGIGKVEQNNGILVLISVENRRLEIEVGRGLNDIFPPTWLANLQHTVMIPHLKNDAFGRGVLAGLTEMSETLGRNTKVRRETEGPEFLRAIVLVPNSKWFMWAGIFTPLVVLVMFIAGLKRSNGAGGGVSWGNSGYNDWDSGGSGGGGSFGGGASDGGGGGSDF